MAADVVGVMRALGHERFSVVGHDRGAYVATRLGLTYPSQVERLVILEGMPLVERLERTDWRFALSWWHWWFFGQLDKPAERVINADPDAWYAASADQMGEEAYADLRRALHDPEVVHAMLEDYRAGLREDREDEEADRAAGRRITAPLLVVSLLADDPELGRRVDLVEIWRSWARDVRSAEIEAGHHVAEEQPDELARLLLEFLGPRSESLPLERRQPFGDAGAVRAPGLRALLLTVLPAGAQQHPLGRVLAELEAAEAANRLSGGESERAPVREADLERLARGPCLETRPVASLCHDRALA
jgi:haloacetate dehalogenase